MDPNAFYCALKEAIDNSNNEDIKITFSKFGFDENAKNSFIKGDNSIIYPTETEKRKNPKYLKDEIIKFIDKNKKLICDNYCKRTIDSKPEWIKEIEAFYIKE